MWRVYCGIKSVLLVLLHDTVYGHYSMCTLVEYHSLAYHLCRGNTLDRLKSPSEPARLSDKGMKRSHCVHALTGSTKHRVERPCTYLAHTTLEAAPISCHPRLALDIPSPRCKLARAHFGNKSPLCFVQMAAAAL